MGTSSSFKGKKGDTLLPSDYDEDNIMEIEEDGQEVQKDTWTSAKTSMSRYISTEGKVGSPKQIVKKYIKAAGGTKRILSAIGKNRVAILSLNNILNSFATKGLTKTLEDINISLKDISLSEAMSKLVNYIYESSVTKNDSAITAALADTLSEIKESDFNNDKLDEYSSRVIMERFFSELIWQQMLIDFGYSFEKYGDNNEELVERENEMKEYIKACVEESFKEFNDVVFSKDIYNTVFRRSLEIMEG